MIPIKAKKTNFQLGNELEQRIGEMLVDGSKADGTVLADLGHYLDGHGYYIFEMNNSDTGDLVGLAETNLLYKPDSEVKIYEARTGQKKDSSRFLGEVLCTNIGQTQRTQTFFDWYAYKGKGEDGKHHFEPKRTKKIPQLTPP